MADENAPRAEVHKALYNPATGDWTAGDLLATSGGSDCQDVRCSRIGGRCVGMHCSKCGEPCGSQGHVCKRTRGEPRLCCDFFVEHSADEWGGTYCKLPFGHGGEHSAHYPTGVGVERSEEGS